MRHAALALTTLALAGAGVLASRETHDARAQNAPASRDTLRLPALMRHVFDYRGAPISRLTVDVSPDGVRQRGILHKGVDIPFDMTSSVSLTPDGRIQLKPSRLKILGVNGLVLMRALGLNLAKMMDLSKAQGITVSGNDLFLDPIAILPPPRIRGRVSSVRIEGDRLVQIIGSPPDSNERAPAADPTVKNYMFYRGGTLHF